MKRDSCEYIVLPRMSRVVVGFSEMWHNSAHFFLLVVVKLP